MRHKTSKPASSRRRLALIVVLVFAVLGSIFVWRSFAANPRLPGDLNNDNVVNLSDLSTLLSSYGKASTAADLNGDGRVTLVDLSILLGNYGKRVAANPTPTPPTPTPPTPTPPTPTPPTPTPPTPTPGAQPAITRSGTKLMRNGQQWKFAGVNADKWFGCWGGEEVPSDADLEKYFSQLNPHSLTRIWPYDHMGDKAMMDKVIAAAAKHGQYLMVTLFDGNDGQCGSDAIGNVSSNMSAITPFIQNYAKGKHPNANAIAVWELSNEDCNGGWFKDMAPRIKQLDPNTLISTGSHAAWCYDGTGGYISAHDSPAIDLISMHEYDSGYSHWSGASIEAAKALNKPWFSGESGLCCGGGGSGSASENANKLKKEWTDYVNQSESAGMLYWALRQNTGSSDIILSGGPMWDLAKSYRHQWHGN